MEGFISAKSNKAFFIVVANILLAPISSNKRFLILNASSSVVSNACCSHDLEIYIWWQYVSWFFHLL